MKSLWATPTANENGGDLKKKAARRAKAKAKWGGQCPPRYRSEDSMAHTDITRLEGAEREALQGQRGGYEGRATGEPSGAWSNAKWITGADGKSRRVEPGVRLLAHGVPARVAKLRALGNAIVPQVAAEFIKAFLDTYSDK